MQKIYLDNAATTKPYKQVVEKMSEVALEYYANPSSLHIMGMDAEHIITSARKTLADALECRADEVVFTSGGTESDNMAILGYATGAKRKGNHIITTKIEHPAVLEPMRRLEDEGFEVDFVGVDQQGVVDVEQFAKLVRSDTILASVMLVNNEVGSIQPVATLKEMLLSAAPRAVLHTDAVQAFGKMPVRPAELGADLISVSGHKLHGPKGIGALYMKKGLKINPLILGGGQERALKSGTENVPGIAGLAEAVRLSCEHMQRSGKQVATVKARLMELIRENIPRVQFNGAGGSEYLLNVTFEGVKAEVLLHALESHGVFVSTGSACSSRHQESSKTLLAMGLDCFLMEGTIRFSFCEFNTIDEIEYTADVLKQEVENIRQYTKK